MRHGQCGLSEVRERGARTLRTMLLLLDGPESPASIWRSHLDPWFAYTMKGPFLARTGNAHTFDAIRSTNLGRLRRLRPALLCMHWISDDALVSLDNRSDRILVKDHTYPVRAVRDRAHIERPKTVGELDDFLRRWYRVAVLTKEQHMSASGSVENEYVRRMSDMSSPDYSKYESIEGNVTSFTIPKCDFLGDT